MNTSRLFRLILLFLLIGACSSKRSKEQITNLDELSHAQIAVPTGSAADKLIYQRLPEAEIAYYNSTLDGVIAVLNDQVDAVAYDEPIMRLYQTKIPGLLLLDEPITVDQYGMAIHPDNSDLKKSADSLLRVLVEDGRLDDMLTRWFSGDDNKAKIPEMQWEATNGVLNFGTSAIVEPFSYYDNSRKITGFDIELATLLAQSLGRELKIYDMDFGGLIPSLLSQKTDIVAACLTITEERAKSVLFTDPYYTGGISALVKDHNIQSSQDKRYSNLKDVGNGRIGVVLGTTHDKFVSENYPEANVLHFEGNPDLILAIKAGQAEAVVGDRSILGPYLRKNPELVIFEDDLFEQPFGFGFGDEKLRDTFNEYLADIRSSGTLEAIINKWENSDENTKLNEYHFSEENGTLKIGVTGVSAPFAFLSQGEYVGIDIDIIHGFAAIHGYKPELQTMHFPSLIASITTKKVDIIGSPVTITEERKKQILFSDCYYPSASVAITHRKNVAESELNLAKELGYQANQAQSSGGWFAGVKESFYNNIIKEKRYLLLLNGFKVTFIIAILSAIFGTLLGALVCYMRMSKRNSLQIIAKIYIDILRGVPQVVLLMLMFYIVFASWNIGGITVAIITFAMNFAAYVSEMFRTSIESIKRGQTEAGIAMGFSKVKTFVNIIMPQAIKRVIPIYKGELIALVKITSIVGYIAVQDLTKASDIIRSRTFDAFFPLIMVAVIYFVLAWLLTLLLDAIELKINN